MGISRGIILVTSSRSCKVLACQSLLPVQLLQFRLRHDRQKGDLEQISAAPFLSSACVIMASSSGADFDMTQAIAIINVLRQTGMWDQALKAADRAAMSQFESGKSDSSHGAMHDGSKRRLFADTPGSFSDDAEEFDVISMTGAEAPKQEPILPSAGTTVPLVPTCKLPPGVESVEMWGKTICTLPKMANRRCTYEKLIQEAGMNAETKEYLAWINRNAHKSAKAADLKNYMQAMKYDPSKVTGVNYPGTTAIREFGE